MSPRSYILFMMALQLTVISFGTFQDLVIKINYPKFRVSWLRGFGITDVKVGDFLQQDRSVGCIKQS